MSPLSLLTRNAQGVLLCPLSLLIIVSWFTPQSCAAQCKDCIAEVPVVFHVMYDIKNKPKKDVSDADIMKELNMLILDFKGENADTTLIPPDFKFFFRKPKIEFCIAAKEDGTPAIFHHEIKRKNFHLKRRTIFREGQSFAMDPTKHLNVFIGNLRGGRTLGYVNGDPWMNPRTDGVALHYATIGDVERTITHEVGHWLGLLHTFNNDNIDDTPQQHRTGGRNCPTHPRVHYTEPAMFLNFMDYSDCRVMFTEGQVGRMHLILKTRRKKFLTY